MNNQDNRPNNLFDSIIGFINEIEIDPNYVAKTKERIKAHKAAREAKNDAREAKLLIEDRKKPPYVLLIIAIIIFILALYFYATYLKY